MRVSRPPSRESPKYVLLGTDTFVVRNGRIVTQTFAAHLRS